MPREMFYASEVLDRNPENRKVPLADLLEQENSLVLPLWRSRNLFHVEEEITSIARFSPTFFASENVEWLFLGHYQNAPLFALDFSHLELNAIAWLEEQYRFEEVRRLITSLSNEEASLLAYARGMMTWHRNHRFCGKCGSPTAIQSNGHERRCQNRDCGKVAYPRVDPAVIVLIEHEFEDGITRCLLGRTNRYPEGMYSTLAGFVEPGESLEMTVKREMKEEVGLAVENIRYIASQPWPFPTSLMLGFFATARETKIELDKNEVSEVRWFSRDELKLESDAGRIKLSRIDSIARHLITTWLQGH